VANKLKLFRHGAVGFIDWLDRRKTVGCKFERYLNFSATSIRLKFPTLAAVNTCLIKYFKARALCDRNRCDAASFSINVANEQTFAFRSLPVWERRISRSWRVDGDALSLRASNSCRRESETDCNA
jgi:hypothetical protein